MAQHRISRRTLLRSAGGLFVLAAGGGVWRAWDEGVFSAGTGPAYEPWRDWQSDAGPGPLRLVRAAILASNAHNTQPWLFQVSETVIDVFADTTRNIGAMDPLRREMYIGIGCAIENLCIAAAVDGYGPRVSLMPDPANLSLAARVDLHRLPPVASPLYAAIPERHTNRYAYAAGHPIPPAVLRQMSALVSEPDVQLTWFTAADARHQIAALTVEATEAIIADEGQSRASASWYRHDWSSIQSHRDGVTIDAQGLSPVATALGKMLPAGSRAQSDAFWLSATRDVQAPTAAAFGLISIHRLSDHSQRLRAGRVWQRLHLWATAVGLAMQPLNQIIERADREIDIDVPQRFGAVIESLVANTQWRPVFLFRAGYPSHTAAPSPRRSIQSILM